MLSRIFWVGVAGIAIVTGMILQDGGRMFAWADDRTDISAKTERAIETSIERAIDGGFDRMQVIDSDGNEMDVPPETKRAMGDAVGRLVKAEADLAILKVRDAGDDEIQAATARRAQARADVDRLKAEIRAQEKAASLEQQAVSEQVRREVRDEIRAEIRDAVRN